jgi:ketosteroid isomerase-like protein
MSCQYTCEGKNTVDLTPLAVVKRFEELFMEGDRQATLAVIGEDQVTHEAPSLPYAGDFHGHAGWLELAHAFTDTWEPVGEIQCEYSELGTDTVVARVVLDVVARATGKPVQLRIAEFHRVAGGKIRETTIYYWDTAAMLAALTP